MEILTGESLFRALDFCRKNNGARVCVVCRTAWSAQQLADSLMQKIQHRELPNWTYSLNKSLLYEAVANFRLCRVDVGEASGRTFTSNLKVFGYSGPNQWMGDRFHMILVEDGIPGEWLVELAGREVTHENMMPKIASDEDIDAFIMG